MHIPTYNAASNDDELHKFIQQNQLGILTTAIPSTTYNLLQASHIPWLLDVPSDGTSIRLRGHIARQNPQAKAMIEALTTSLPAQTATHLSNEVLVIFNGPVHHYVTPKFYKSTKPATGKVVPTWDYEAVEVYGKAKILHDKDSAESKDFLATQIRELSQHMETSAMGYDGVQGPEPWAVSDAPTPYIDILTKNIIGIEIEVSSMAGRFKWSQEKPVGDRAGVADGFQQMDHPHGVQLASKVEHRAAVFDAEKAAKAS